MDYLQNLSLSLDAHTSPTLDLLCILACLDGPLEVSLTSILKAPDQFQAVAIYLFVFLSFQNVRVYQNTKMYTLNIHNFHLSIIPQKAGGKETKFLVNCFFFF